MKRKDIGPLAEPDRESELLSHMMWNELEAAYTMRAEAINMKNESDKVVRLHIDTAACERAYRAVLAEDARREAAEKLEEQQRACLTQAEETMAAREALKTVNDHLDERERVFCNFKTSVEVTLADAILRAEAAEGSLATSETTVSIQQAAGLKLEQDLAALKEEHSLQEEALSTSQRQLATLQEQHTVLKQAHDTTQGCLAGLQHEHEALKQQANAVLSEAQGKTHEAEEKLASAAQHIRALQEQLARAAQAPAVVVPEEPCTVPPPAASQVPAYLQPVISWVEKVAHFAPLRISDTSVLLDHIVQQGSDKAALEATIKEIQEEAYHVLPGAQLSHEYKKRFLAFVEEGPAGWVCTPQANPFPASTSTAASASSTFTPASAPTPASTPAITTVTTTNTVANLGAPGVPDAAPIPASLRARAVNGAKSQQIDQIGATSSRSRRRVGG